MLADRKIREFLTRSSSWLLSARIVIERAWNSIRVTIHTARPGVVIGRKGAEIEKMTEEISRLAGGKQVKIDIIEIKTPELDAQLVAENVAFQIERRICFRRAMKRAVQPTMEQGALGIKLRCAGRLGGAEIAAHRVVSRRQDSRFTPCASRSTTASLKPRPSPERSASSAGSARSQPVLKAKTKNNTQFSKERPRASEGRNPYRLT